MPQLVRLEGKHSTQNAHCAVALKIVFFCVFDQFQKMTMNVEENAEKTSPDSVSWCLASQSAASEMIDFLAT